MVSYTHPSPCQKKNGKWKKDNQIIFPHGGEGTDAQKKASPSATMLKL